MRRPPDPAVSFRDEEEGCWWILPPSHIGTDDDLQVHGVTAERARYRGWWRSLTYPPGNVTVLRAERTDVIGYVQNPGVVLVGVKDRLTPDEWRTVTLADADSDDLEVADPVVVSLAATVKANFSAVRGDPYRSTVDPEWEWLELDGQPADPLPEGATWEADLPFVLREWPQVRHQIPGRLRGIEAAVKADLDGRNGNAVNAHWQSGPDVKVYVKVRYDKPVQATSWPAGRKRPTRKTVETLTKAIVLRPGEVRGANLAEAIERWDEVLLEMRAQVDAVKALVCSACGGNGVIIEGPGK